MITVEEAVERLDEAVRPLEAVSVPLAEAAGHVLAGHIVADRDFPPTDRSAMDGYAVRCADLANSATLKVVGEVQAGAAAVDVVGAGEACRVFTGAVIPTGADAVVMVEKTEPGRVPGTVRIDDRPAAGQHIRTQAQDLRCGQGILAPGTAIRAAEIAALASVGVVRVPVYRRPRVAVLSTGDEVVAPHETPRPHQIRNSNTPMLVAQARAAGFDAHDIGAAPDERERLREKLAQGLGFDLLLVSGGVSVGDYDLVAEELVQAGVETLFHGIAMKPGKPILAGRTSVGLVLGLPGNPVSAFVGFKLFGEPLLKRMAGIERPWPAPIRVRLRGKLRQRPGRQTYHLARVTFGAEGPSASPVKSTGSGDVLSLSRANALVVTPPDASGAETGELLDALLF